MSADSVAMHASAAQAGARVFGKSPDDYVMRRDSTAKAIDPPPVTDFSFEGRKYHQSCGLRSVSGRPSTSRASPAHRDTRTRRCSPSRRGAVRGCGRRIAPNSVRRMATNRGKLFAASYNCQVMAAVAKPRPRPGSPAPVLRRKSRDPCRVAERTNWQWPDDLPTPRLHQHADGKRGGPV
jgi:hypothetical protein